MNNKPSFEMPQPIIEDTEKYEGYVEKFLKGDLSDSRFKGYRVPMGVYGQRGEEDKINKYMVRVRMPGGVATRQQLETLADISEEYGKGFVHFTTRQDIQIHQVDIEDTPEILYKLLEVNLSPRGGGGNTVRNIANASRAGVHPEEAFDTTPYALALSEYLLTPRSSFNLPRKYKIAFSPTANDEALATINDLGLIAKIKDGQKGFKVYAAGGLGNSPKTAILLDEFVQVDRIFHVAEAIKRLFDDHGDRNNKYHARLRFVREKFEKKKFIQLYNKYYKEVIEESIDTRLINTYKSLREDFDYNKKDSKKIISKNYIYPEKYDGYFSLKLNPENGDLKAEEIRDLLQIVDEDEISLRTTNKQGLLIRGIKINKLEEKITAISNIDKNLLVDKSLSPVACKGASTCRLGLCLSPNLAQEIKNELSTLNYEEYNSIPQIYISGCPNCCGQHPIGKIGFEGKAKRHNGRLIPCYSLLIGGRIFEDKSKFGQNIIDIPTKRIPEFLKELAINLNQDENYSLDNFYSFLENNGIDKMKNIAEKYTKIPDYEENPDLYKDWHQEEDFSLEGRGPGECGTGVMDIVALDIESAQDNYETGIEDDNNDKLYQSIIDAARSLLIVRGVDTEKDRVIIDEFRDKFINKDLVTERYNELLDLALDYRLGDEDSLLEYKNRIENLISRVEKLFNSLNADLEFVLDEENNEKDDDKKENKQEIEESQKKTAVSEEKEKEEIEIKDLRGVECPMNYVKAKLFMEPLPPETIVKFYLDKGEPIKNVPESLSKSGHEILKKEKKEAGHYILKVQKKE